MKRGDVALDDAGVDAGTGECVADSECRAVSTRDDCEGPTEYRAMRSDEARRMMEAPGLPAEDGGWCPRYEDASAKVALCEARRCVLYDAAAAVAWATAVVPAVGSLELASDVSIAGAPWFKEGGHVVLYVRGDWRGASDSGHCHAIDFVAGENGLHANLRFDSDCPAPPSEWSDAIDLEKNATRMAGRYKPDAYASSGDWEALSNYGLSAADDAGVAYEQVQSNLSARGTSSSGTAASGRRVAPAKSCFARSR